MTERSGLLGRLEAYLRPQGAGYDRERSLNVVLLGLAGVLVTLAAFFGLVIWILLGFPMTLVTWMLGEKCVSWQQIDCVRAVGDARQAVLFTAGGIIAIVGIIFTWLRWRTEEKLARKAVADGERADRQHERADQQHARESDRTQRANVLEAIGLLDDRNAPKRSAAIQLLDAHASSSADQDVLQVVLVLKALETYIRQELEDDLHRDTVLVALRSALKISNAHQKHLDLSKLTLKDMNLSGTTWFYADLSNSLVEECDLTRAHFGGGAWSGNFYRDLKFDNCILDRTNFDGADLIGTKFSGHVDYTEDDNGRAAGRFHNVTFQGATLKKVVLTTQDIRFVDFTDANLIGVKFDSCRLASPRFEPSALARCDFTTSRFEIVRLDGASILECGFTTQQLVSRF